MSREEPEGFERGLAVRRDSITSNADQWVV